MIDTGASLSAIDDEVVSTLGIVPVGQTQSHTAQVLGVKMRVGEVQESEAVGGKEE